MWKSSAPRTPRTLAREFVVVTLAVLIIWLIIGGSFWVLVAYLAIYLVVVIMRALNIKTADRPDRAAVAEMLRRHKGRGGNS
jgi:uncharacterized membrane protein YgcG